MPGFFGVFGAEMAVQAIALVHGRTALAQEAVQSGAG